MKKNHSYIYTSLLLSLVMLVISSCTLSMEDWIQPEEEKGYGELAKIENDFFKYSYQYKDYTRSLTDSILGYVVNVEADSIIYFMDNIPQQFLPKAGGCVVCNCCPEFPQGLINRVLSVERENGMYKVVTTVTTIDDAFEDFYFELDADIVSTNSKEDMTRAVNTRSVTDGNGPDSVIIDWSMYNLMTKDHKVKNVTGVATRATNEEFDKDVTDDNVDHSDEKETPFFVIDESNLFVQGILSSFDKSIVNRFFMGLYGETKTHVKKIIDLKKKREYTATTTHSGTRISYAIGKDFIKEKENSALSMQKTTESFEGWKRFARDNKSDLSYSESCKGLLSKINETGAVWQFPLGSAPICGVVRIKPNLDFTLGIFGSGDIYIWNSASKTVSDVIDGKTVQDYTWNSKDNPDKVKKKDNQWDANIEGRFALSGSLELFVGVAPKMPPGTEKFYGIGGFVSGGLNLVGQFSPITFGDNTLGNANSAVTLTADIEAGAKVLAGDYDDVKLGSGKWTVWKGVDVPYYPRFAAYSSDPVLNDFKYIEGEDSKGLYKQFTVSYKLTDLGMMIPVSLTARYTPGLYLYKNTIDPKNRIDVPIDTKVTKVKAGVVYSFTYKTYEVSVAYVAVPYLRYTFANGKSNVTEFQDMQRYIESIEVPRIGYVTTPTGEKNKEKKEYHDHVYQTVGYELGEDYNEYLKDEYNIMYDPNKTYYEFEYAMPFELYNSRAIPEQWEDWGIVYSATYQFRDPGTKKIYDTHKTGDVYKSLMSTAKKSGKYLPRFSFAVSASKADYLPEAWATCAIYYVKKGDPTHEKHLAIGTSQLDYVMEPVSYGNINNAKLLKQSLDLKVPFEKLDYKWLGSYKDITIKPKFK